ncbi:BioD-like phosphotransacetylase family protein [Methanohalophilus levihalophilus]|uniref:phosphotransacetylase family protein n=1 Tax=Methanohalophilus levihalophilus TaxID=1431282 RepID=UPI001AE27125|nr:phosphotransacetylase family protein [Methanohalophilus levihalophilus]MBP2030919.1 BioD-like phosphotransacetylase family protein [Methanohalophilus levihalophilus]
MGSILVSSSEQYSGKSSLCIGLAVILKNKGFSVGYMKPVGNLLVDVDGTLSDEDSEQALQILGLTDDRQYMTPVMLTENLIEDALHDEDGKLEDKILHSYSQIAEGKDAVVIEGSGGIGGGMMYNLSDPHVASLLDTRILLITRYDSIQAVDRILCDIKLIPEPWMLAGVILNEVEENDLKQVKELVVPFLKRKEIEVHGIIPKDRTLRSITISEIVEDLHGDVLSGSENLGELIDHYLVGAMEVNSAIKYFRRSPNSVVITGGDRSDVQMAAIEAGVKALVLTGNLRPSEAVLGSADEAGVPIVLVRGDTMSTIERMEALIGHTRIGQKTKLSRIVELVEDNVDIDSIISSMGLGEE